MDLVPVSPSARDWNYGIFRFWFSFFFFFLFYPFCTFDSRCNNVITRYRFEYYYYYLCAYANLRGYNFQYLVCVCVHARLAAAATTTTTVYATIGRTQCAHKLAFINNPAERLVPENDRREKNEEKINVSTHAIDRFCVRRRWFV